MAESFQRDSDMFKIPFLRALLSANIDATFKKKYGVVYTKSQGQPLFIEFMSKCLTSMVKIPSSGDWKDTIAGKLITATGPGHTQEKVFFALQKLCEVRMEKFISPSADQDQCRYVGIVNNTSGCTYNLNDTYPIINNGAVNSSRGLWTNGTWCNNCWLCGLPVGESGYPYTKQCEHILPYLTGSILLGTATNNQLVINQDTKREYGQSHAICNMFKNQGEFIKFDPSTITFTRDIEQICNYIEELTGIKLDKETGQQIWTSDIVSTKTIDSFTQIFEKKKIGGLAGPAQRTQLAEDMYITITNVIHTLCTTSLSRENISDDFMAKLLYTAILNFLVDSQVRAALILSKGAIIDFRSKLQESYQMLFPSASTGVFPPYPKPFTPDEVVGLITAYRSPFTTKQITERLKNYINDDKVPKPLKYMILAKTLYDSFKAMIPTNSFGSPPRRVRAPDQKDRDKISKTIQKQTLKKLQSNIIDNVLKEDQELLPYCILLEQRTFKDNLLIIINVLGNITYGDLYSKLTYTTDGQNYDDDEKVTIQNGKIILPALVYTIYENFDRMDDRELDNFLGIINEFFPLLTPRYLKIFSAYIYGLSVINLLNYDLDLLAKRTFESQVLSNQFGKKSRNLKSMSENELKNKLKSVGILVTKKFNKKRLPLTRKQLEQKAREFTKLQLKAKIKNIKITYIGRDGTRKYKSYKRLLSDLEKINRFGTPRQSERLRLRRQEAYDQAMNIERAADYFAARRYNERLIQQEEQRRLESAREEARAERRCRAMGSDENRGIKNYSYNPFTRDCRPNYYNSRPPLQRESPEETDAVPPPIRRMNAAITPASQEFGRGLIKTLKPMVKSAARDFKEELKKRAQEDARKKALELKKRALIEAKTKMYNKNNVKIVRDKQNNTIITASRMG